MHTNSGENPRFLIGGNGPLVLASTMLGGTENIFAATQIKTERDAFNTRHLLNPNVASVHGILNQTRESIIQAILNEKVPYDRRAHRILLRQ